VTAPGIDVAYCCEDGCHRPATTKRLVGVLPFAPPVDGVPDPDGFSWLVELVCADHTDGAA